MEYRPIARQESSLPHTDTAPLYRYCRVQLHARSTVLWYLDKGEELQVGDWVRVPCGKRDTPRLGRVSEVLSCTAAAAPWPPARTKTVLERTDAPAAEQMKAPVTAKASPAAKPPVAYPVPLSAEQPSPEGRNEPKKVKRRIKPRLLSLAVATATAAAIGIGLCVSWNSACTNARKQLLAASYSDAAADLKHVPSFFKNAQLLQRLSTAASALDPAATEQTVRQALDGLQPTEDFAGDGELLALAKQLRATLSDSYTKLRYANAVADIDHGSPDSARDTLAELGDYEDAAVLYIYCEAEEQNIWHSAEEYRAAAALLRRIPADYSGACAAKISTLRNSLQLAEKKWATDAANRQAGLPYIGMPEKDINSTKPLGVGFSDTSYITRQVGFDKKITVKQTEYTWQAAGDRAEIFSAVCEDGVVVNTHRLGGDAVWNGSRLRVKVYHSDPSSLSSFGSKKTDSASTTRKNHYQEHYDSPEDLYEDGEFDDLDEAVDAWYDR